MFRRLVVVSSIVLVLVLLNAAASLAADTTTGPSSVRVAGLPGVRTLPNAKQVSVNSWTHKVCVALSSWETTIKSSSSSISSQLSGAGSVADARSVLVRFLQQATDRTAQLVRDIDAAGIPKVRQGKAVAQFFHSGFTQIQQLFAQSVTSARALPDNPQAFSSGATTLGTQIESGGAQIQKVFSDAKGRFNIPSLDKAFNKDSTCSSVRSS